MVVQASTQKGICEHDVTFPDGQVQAKCQYKYCGAVWSLGEEGFWDITSVPIAPSYREMKERRKDRYEGMLRNRKGVKR